MTTDSGARPIRVVIADDQHIVREGLVTVLSLVDGIEVVGEAANGREAVERVAEHAPDVVLMDLRMPVLDGAGATREIVERHPDVAVLVLTTFDDDASISRALTAGARGYLTKDAGRDDIAAALRTVSRGQATFDAAVTARIVAGLGSAATEAAAVDAPDPDARGGAPAEVPHGWGALTPREREVLDLIGRGLSNPEIAAELFVSTATVKTHINNLFAKLGLRDRAQAIRLAMRTHGAE